MRYEKLLNEMIKQSQLSQAEIVRRCKNMGVDLDKSYLSRLRNGKASSPRPEISKAIAKVCGCDEILLVIEGFLDDAPKDLVDVLLSLKLITTGCKLNFLRQNATKQDFELAREQLRNQPISEFILKLKDLPSIAIESLKDKLTLQEGNVYFNFNRPTYPVQDNSMEPLIPKGSEITATPIIYKDGEIYLIEYEHTLLIRKSILNPPNNIILIPLNSDFEVLNKPVSELKFIGKVDTVTQKL